jgi:hypothetical protein
MLLNRFIIIEEFWTVNKNLSPNLRKNLHLNLRFTLAHNFLHANVHQNDIRTNLPDAFPANNVFRISSKQTAPFPLTGNNQLADAPRIRVKFHIRHKTDPLTIPHINDFLLAKFTNTHAALHKTFLILSYAAGRIK